MEGLPVKQALSQYFSPKPIFFSKFHSGKNRFAIIETYIFRLQKMPLHRRGIDVDYAVNILFIR